MHYLARYITSLHQIQKRMCPLKMYFLCAPSVNNLAASSFAPKTVAPSLIVEHRHGVDQNMPPINQNANKRKLSENPSECIEGSPKKNISSAESRCKIHNTVCKIRTVQSKTNLGRLYYSCTDCPKSFRGWADTHHPRCPFHDCTTLIKISNSKSNPMRKYYHCPKKTKKKKKCRYSFFKWLDEV